MEAEIVDGVPQTAGWFVLNAADAPWAWSDERGARCRFGGEGEAHFDDLGIGLAELQPGQHLALYHHEAGQEDFLVLAGECIAIVEGIERPLRRFDLLHCPPRTPHAIVGAGDGPALVLAVGARKERGSARYPAAPAAIRRGAGVETDAERAAEAYAGRPEPVAGPPPPSVAR
jgi:uncharacterized cupin superfamily protein